MFGAWWGMFFFFPTLRLGIEAFHHFHNPCSLCDSRGQTEGCPSGTTLLYYLNSRYPSLESAGLLSRRLREL